MKLKVTQEGVLIPKELLGDSQEVEINQQQDQIIITILNNFNMSNNKINVTETENESEQISNSKSCYDLARELGIIGIAENLPADLSTNHDYFEGFGK
jgi:hypothetical protein